MAEGKFIVSAQNRIKEGLDAAKKDLSGFEEATKKIGESITRALTVTAIIAGLKKLGEAAFDAYQEFGESERRLKQLKIALDGNESSFRKATDLIDSMRKMSLASKGDIEGLVSELAALGKSDKQIDQLTQAAVHLSNVTGKDLTTAYNMLATAESGQVKGLKVLIPEVANLSKEQLANGDATKIVIDRFSTLSEKLAADNIPQKLKNLKDSFSDLGENIGKQTESFFSPVLTGIQAIVDKWNDAFEASEAYRKNVLTMKDTETKVAGERLTAAIANARIDRDKYLQAFQMAMLTTPGLNRMVGGQATPIYTPQQAYEKGIFADILGNYFQQSGNVKAFEQALERFNQANPGWNTAGRTTTTGGAPLTGGVGTDPSKDVYNRYSAIPSASFFGLDRIGFDPEASLQIGNVAALLLNGIVKPFDDFRDDLESYGWNADMLAKPIKDFRDDLESYGWTEDILAKPFIEFRDDLESYGWEGLGETAFDRMRKGWAKSIDQGDRPDEGGAYSQRYDASDPGMRAFSDWADSIGKFTRDDMESYGWTAENLAKPVIEFRDDLENYGWDGLGETAFDAFRMGWAKAQDAYNPDEPGTNGTPESVYIRAGANTVAQSVFAQFERVSLEFRDDLENVGWEGLGETAFDAFRVGWAKAQDAYNVDEGGGYTPPVFYNPATAGNTAPSWLEKLGQSLGPLLESLGETLGPMLSSMASISMILNPITTILSGAMEVLKPFIDEALTPVIGSMKVLGAMLGQMLVPVIQFLTPIIVKLAEVFVWLYNNVFRHIGNLIIMVLGGFVNAISGLVRTITFGLVNMGQVDTDSMMMGKIDMGTVTAAGTSAVSDSTAATSASYRTQAITINIYQSAPVVGSDGMGEFARMIRGELDALAYAGQ